MSTLKVNALQDTSGNEFYPARAWGLLDGTGTVSITANGNVSSMSDYGTGSYGISYASSLSGSNYAWVGDATNFTDGTKRSCNILASANDGTAVSKSTSATRFVTGQSNQTAVYDSKNISISVTI